jgi:hypothetical protein
LSPGSFELANQRKSVDSSSAIVPLGKDFKSKFNELDNWLGIMDIDPPRTEIEKRAMYIRLIDILDDLFKTGSSGKRRAVHFARNKKQIQQMMQKIIEP